MSKITYMKLLMGSFIFGITVSFFGCGKSSGGGLPADPGFGNTTQYPGVGGVPGGSCPSVFNGYSCHDSCSGASGFPITAVGGASLCRYSRLSTSIYFGSYGNLATLTMPMDNQAFLTPISVAAGETIKVLSVSGGWGSINQPTSDSCFFGLLTCTTWQSGCNVTVQVNGSLASSANGGLYVSDGNGIAPAVLGQPGLLSSTGGLVRFGFNTFTQYGSACGGATVGFSIQRCVDVAGNSYACP